jgi:NAD(P)-dependent dehydrogenase (short-subunit alcohol dehydrogenase family)
MPNPPSPDSRVIMISGGNRGIGAALARRFAAGGWRISLGVRDPSAPPTGEAPADAFVAEYEAQELPTASSWVEATLARYGRVDAVVCNAGTADTVTLENGTPEQFDRMSAINTRAPFFLTQAAWPALKVSGRGRVVIVSSLSGKRARNLNAGYQVTKFAAVGLAHAIRRTGWESGIRCTAVCPGYVRTRMGLQSGTVDPTAVTDPDELAGLVHEIVNLSNTASVAELVVNCAFEPVY